MTVAFDTLSYAKRLRKAGVPDGQADAHAEAAFYLLRAIQTIMSTPDTPLAKSDVRTDRPALPVSLASAVDRMTWQLTIRFAAMWSAGTVFLVLLSYLWLQR